jgi:hypothetical protein
MEITVDGIATVVRALQPENDIGPKVETFEELVKVTEAKEVQPENA